MKNLTVIMVMIANVFMLQSQGVASILVASEDAAKLSQLYIHPAVNGLIHSVNGGWCSSARVHKPLEFDISVITNFTFVPDSDQYFEFNQADYTYLSLPNSEMTIETLMGSTNRATTVDVKIPVDGNAFKIASFEMPEGIGGDLPFNAVPAPLIQIGMGLPARTEVKFRIVPELKFDYNIKGGLYGLGFQHDLTQYFRSKKKKVSSDDEDALVATDNVSIGNRTSTLKDGTGFHLSLLGAFCKTGFSRDIKQDEIVDDVVVTRARGEYEMNAWTIQAISSFDFRRFSIYGAVGIYNAEATAEMLGDYNLSYDVEHASGFVIGTVEESISDPIKLKFEAKSVRATIGARLNLGVFKVFGDFTLQEYNTVSTGVAIGFK